MKKNDGFGREFNEYKVYHPIIEKLFGDDENLPNHVVTAHDIDPYFRVKMQGVIQKYIDLQYHQPLTSKMISRKKLLQIFT